MKGDQQEFRDAIRSLARGDAAGGEEHPTPEELVAYARGADAGVEVQDHIAVCKVCAGLLLDFESFPSYEDAEARPGTDAEVAAGWEQLRRRLPEVEPVAANAPPASDVPSAADVDAAAPNKVVSLDARRERRAALAAGFVYPIAASLLVGAIALAFWVASLRGENERLARERDRLAADLDRRTAEREREASAREQEEIGRARDDAAARARLDEARRELEADKRRLARRESRYEAEVAELRRPRAAAAASPEGATANAPAFDLYPEETLRGAEDEPAAVEIPSASGSVVFTLNSLRREGAPGSRRLEIVDSDGKIVWSRGGLRESARGSFRVRLPGRLLSAGRYRFRLYASPDVPPEEFVVAVSRR